MICEMEQYKLICGWLCYKIVKKKSGEEEGKQGNKKERAVGYVIK